MYNIIIINPPSRYVALAIAIYLSSKSPAIEIIAAILIH